MDSLSNVPMKNTTTSRRTVLKNLSRIALASAALPRIAAAEPSPKLMLGLDAHSVRGMKWSAVPLIKYAGQQKLDAVLLNGLNYFESLEEAPLTKLKALADGQNVKIRIGAGGISGGSPAFKPTFGTPEQALAKAVQVAVALGSPTVNVKIGSIDDRYTPGGIEARMEEAIATMKALRSRAQDAGIKFAFENHAGDTRSDEVLAIIEAVGTDLCGVMLDPGNALWAMEDPMQQIQKLGRHVLCSSVRDYMAWESPEGSTFQWTAIGEGLMDVPAYVGTLKQLCPSAPLFVETISNSARPIPFLTEAFWKGFSNVRAADITAFLALCRKGHALEIQQPPAGTDPKEFDRQHQKSEFIRSITVLRGF
jgi:3-oxoisoapionate decarboxylase